MDDLHWLALWIKTMGDGELGLEKDEQMERSSFRDVSPKLGGIWRGEVKLGYGSVYGSSR